MKIAKLDPFKAGENAFLQDLSNMGIRIGKALEGEDAEVGNRILVMIRNHPDEQCEWAVIVNEATGERIRVDFNDSDNPESERGII